MLPRILRLVISCWIGVVAANTAALGEDKVEVAPGGVVVVKRVPGATTEDKADRRGIVLKTVEGTVPQSTTILLYLAPAGSSQLEDTVRFKVNGNEQAVRVSVRPAAPTLTRSEFYEASFKA